VRSDGVAGKKKEIGGCSKHAKTISEGGVLFKKDILLCYIGGVKRKTKAANVNGPQRGDWLSEENLDHFRIRPPLGETLNRKRREKNRHAENLRKKRQIAISGTCQLRRIALECLRGRLKRRQSKHEKRIPQLCLTKSSPFPKSALNAAKPHPQNDDQNWEGKERLGGKGKKGASGCLATRRLVVTCEGPGPSKVQRRTVRLWSR